MGLFTASFTFLQKFFICVLRIAFAKSYDKKFSFIAACMHYHLKFIVLTALIAMPLCLQKGMRKILTLGTLTLAFVKKKCFKIIGMPV